MSKNVVSELLQNVCALVVLVTGVETHKTLVDST